MVQGTVKWFDTKKGYGFAVDDQGRDVFIHYTNIVGDGFRCLRDGQIIEYEQVDSEKGLAGSNVRIVESKQPKDKEAE